MALKGLSHIQVRHEPVRIHQPARLKGMFLLRRDDAENVHIEGYKPSTIGLPLLNVPHDGTVKPYAAHIGASISQRRQGIIVCRFHVGTVTLRANQNQSVGERGGGRHQRGKENDRAENTFHCGSFFVQLSSLVTIDRIQGITRRHSLAGSICGKRVEARRRVEAGELFAAAVARVNELSLGSKVLDVAIARMKCARQRICHGDGNVAAMNGDLAVG